MPARHNNPKPKQCNRTIGFQGKRRIRCGIYLDPSGNCHVHGSQTSD